METNRRRLLSAALGAVALWSVGCFVATPAIAETAVVHLTLGVEGMH
jgi:hypothetical protein